MTAQRPKLITALCVFLALAWALNIVSISYSVGVVSNERLTWIVLSQLLSGLAIYGIWRLRLWGPLLYFALQVLGISTFFLYPPDGAANYPVWAIFALPAIVAIPLVLNWRSFSKSEVEASGVSNA